jgi:predicted XRE-type DNA-binding protein
MEGPQETQAVVVGYCDVPEFPGYRVGTDGSAWRLKSNGQWKQLHGRRHKKGYRVVTLRRAGVAYDRLVHRLILECFVGPCPDGKEACHDPDPRRDNNALTNLRWDTPKANQADRKKHGTSNEGERHGLAKLTEEQVRLIVSLCEQGEIGQRQIGDLFGVSSGTVNQIWTGRRWQYLRLVPLSKLPVGVHKTPYQGERNHNAKLDPGIVMEIRLLASQGVPQRDIAGMFSISQATVNAVVLRKTWRHVPQ